MRAPEGRVKEEITPRGDGNQCPVACQAPGVLPLRKR